jgi:hypothetical protein
VLEEAERCVREIGEAWLPARRQRLFTTGSAAAGSTPMIPSSGVAPVAAEAGRAECVGDRRVAVPDQQRCLEGEGDPLGDPAGLGFLGDAREQVFQLEHRAVGERVVDAGGDVGLVAAFRMRLVRPVMRGPS